MIGNVRNLMIVLLLTAPLSGLYARHCYCYFTLKAGVFHVLLVSVIT